MSYIGSKARRFCAVLVGLVFFVAGTLKLMDPVGTMLIVREYLNFLHLGFLSGVAMVFAEFFAVAETCLGICLVTGVFRSHRRMWRHIHLLPQPETRLLQDAN